MNRPSAEDLAVVERVLAWLAGPDDDFLNGVSFTYLPPAKYVSGLCTVSARSLTHTAETFAGAFQTLVAQFPHDKEQDAAE